MSEDLGTEDAPAQPQTCGGNTEDVGARTGGSGAGTPAPLPMSGVAAAEGVLARNGPRVATSSFRGVCWHRKSKRWQAAINSSGRHVYLGSFDTEEEAARMFDKVALRVRGSRAKLNFPYEDYVGANGELVTDAKLEALVREARKALIEKQRMLEAQEEAGGVGAKRRRYGNGFDDDLPVTMHVGVGPGGAVSVAPGGGMAFPLTLSPGGGYPPVAADPLAAALARSGVAAAGMPHVTVNVAPAAAVAAPTAVAAPAAAVTPAGGSSTEVLMGLLQASLANGGAAGTTAAAPGLPPAAANGGVEGLLQALAPRLGLSNAAGGGGNISINVNSLSNAAAGGGGVNLNLEGALVHHLLPTLLTHLNNNGSNGITIHASGPAPSPLNSSAADAPPSPRRAQIVATSRPQPLGTSTAAAALNLARAGSSIQLGPAVPNLSRTSSPPALAAPAPAAPAPRSPNHQHHASAWQPVAPAAAPRPVKSEPTATPNPSNDSDVLSHRQHSEPTSSAGRPQSSAPTHGPASDATTCSNGSVVSRFLAAVLRSIPEGATVDCVVPCKDSGLMGYTWTPAPPASASNAPSGSGSAHEQERGREQQQQGRPGAGVWIQGACRSLGTYTTAEDALTACQACMAMLLDFKESLASNGCRNGTAPNAAASASASSGTGMAAPPPPPQAGSSGGGAPGAPAPPADRLDAQDANGHPSFARRSSFLLPSPARVESSEPAAANTAVANTADPFARFSANEQLQQQNQQASDASRPCSNDGSVGAARKAPGTAAAAAAAAPAATTDEQLAVDTLSLMLRRNQSGPLPRQPSTHAADTQQPQHQQQQQQQQQQAPNASRVTLQPAAARAEALQLPHTQQPLQQQQQQVSFRRAADQPHIVGGSANSAFVPAVPRVTEATAHQGPLNFMQQQHQQQQQIVINAVPRTAVPASALLAAQDGSRTEGRTAQGFTFSRQQPVRPAGCSGEEERPRQRLRVSGPEVQQQQQQRPLQVQLQGTNIMLDLQALANKSHGRLTMADLVRAAGALSMVNV